MASRCQSVWRACICALLAVCLFAQDAAPAKKALDLLLASRFPELLQLLNTSAKEKLTSEFLRDRVGPELKGFGTVQEIGTPVMANAGDNELFSFPVRFSKTSVNIQFLVDPDGRIGGVYLRPQDDPLPPTWQRPSYSNSASFHERAITVGSDEWKLGGTLTVPVGKGPFPAVVLIHGPGPNDRDESIFTSRIFADIAEGLSSRGIVVLRYDKRTKIYGPQMAPLAWTLKEETIDDAVRALALVRTEPEVDRTRVYVLGHSLGGYALPRIAKADGKLAGMIFLAANARRIEDISVAQVEAMVAARGGATPEEQQRIDALKSEAAEVRALAPGRQHPDLLMGFPAEYFLDLRGYDAPAEAKRLGLPMLFLQGGRDFQITSADLNLWKAGTSGAKVTVHEYPSLNNLFISGQGPSNPAEYRKGGNVAPAVIDDIASWILAPKR